MSTRTEIAESFRTLEDLRELVAATDAALWAARRCHIPTEDFERLHSEAEAALDREETRKRQLVESWESDGGASA